MSSVFPARTKRKAAASRNRAAILEPLAIVEVPPDRRIFEDALLLLQPLWLRAGGPLLLLAGWVALLVFMDPFFTDVPRIVAKFILAVPLALIGIVFMGLFMILRRRTLRRPVDRWMRFASRDGGDRIEINRDGLVRRGASIPWSDISDAVELESIEMTMLAVMVRGSWIILPSSCFTLSDFNGARALMLRTLGDKLRIKMTG